MIGKGGRPWKVERCSDCGRGPKDAYYGARGFCSACYKRRVRSGEIIPGQPRMVRPKRTVTPQQLHRLPLDLRYVIRSIGATATAEAIGVEPDTIRAWAAGETVPDVAVERAKRIRVKVKGGWKPWATE